MATRIWSGATNGNFGTATNYVGGVAPVNNDTVIFDRGNVDVDAGLTSGLTGITMIGTRGYGGRIGPATALSIALTLLRWDLSGDLNLTGNITLGNVMCRQGASMNYTGGTATRLNLGCDAQIQAAAVVTNMDVNARVRVVALANGTGFTQCKLTEGARLISHRSGKYVIGDGAQVRILDSAAVSTASEIRAGGLMSYEGDQNFAGSVEVENKGALTLQRAPESITIPTLIRHPGADINLYTASGEATVTSEEIRGLNDVGTTGFVGETPL